jgi:hypothetical protein
VELEERLTVPTPEPAVAERFEIVQVVVANGIRAARRRAPVSIVKIRPKCAGLNPAVNVERSCGA